MRKKLEHPLKKAIYEHNMTIDSFCSVSGLAYSTLYNIFIGKANVRGDTINLIANTLNISFDEASSLCQVQTRLF